jgi:hypothetical protein
VVTEISERVSGSYNHPEGVAAAFIELIRRLDYRELAIGWEKRELEPSNFRQSLEAILVDFQRLNLRFQR